MLKFISAAFKKMNKHLNTFYTKKRWIAIPSIIVVGIFIVGAVVAIDPNSPSHAELQFAEFSKNKDIKGSILPASCESFPTVGTHHTGINSVDGGHCAATCPLNTRIVNVAYTYCIDPYNIFDPGVWQEPPCSTAPYTLDSYTGNVLIYPLCRWAYNPACPAYYIDQACPPPPTPPVVNINFQ